jgi:hypothetical protein
MFKHFNNRRIKGQSTLEYAILVIIIIGALLTIQVYIKRGIQGRLKGAADDIGDQFSPGNTKVIRVETVDSVTNETFKAGISKSALTTAEVTDITGTSNIINVNQEFWGN